MTTIGLLAEWAIRSSALIAAGAIVLWLLRVKDASIRLAAWTALLAASLAIPALTFTFPKVPIAMMKAASRMIEAPAPAARTVTPEPMRPARPEPRAFDWAHLALEAYSFVALLLLLRLCVGLAMSQRLLRRSRATDRAAEGIPIRESDAVPAPVTLGIVRPAIILPRDWREWDKSKLNAVLAHERSHILRGDPAVQLLSAVHRAVLWHSPLSWFLHRSIVRTAEEASDDAAIAVTQDRAHYAEVLLEFMQRGARRTSWLGVPMARYGRADRRIHRILDGARLSHGVTRWGFTAVVAAVLPLVYLAATVRESQAAPQVQPSAAPVPVQSEPTPVHTAPAAANPPANPGPGRDAAPRRQSAPVYLDGIGNVVASTTLVVRAKVDGELKSLGFEEGKPVEAGQLLATIEPENAQAQIDRAQRDLASDQKRLAIARNAVQPIFELENQVKADQRDIERLQGLLAYGQVRAPFAGVAGLRKVDPGNFVRTGDELVVIVQLQPVAVLFTIPEDNLPEVLTRFRDGAKLTAEAWARDNSAKLATGRLTAIDNQIDKSAGTALLKAMFENKDNALYPNQFVNVRLLLNGR